MPGEQFPQHHAERRLVGAPIKGLAATLFWAKISDFSFEDPDAS